MQVTALWVQGGKGMIAPLASRLAMRACQSGWGRGHPESLPGVPRGPKGEQGCTSLKSTFSDLKESQEGGLEGGKGPSA